MADPYKIKMPQLSDTMTEGIVVSWEKELGDEVKRGDIVATVETDKAIMDVEVFRSGYLSGPRAAVGATLPVGDAMAFLVASQDEVVNEEAEASSGSSESRESGSSTSPSGGSGQRPSRPTPARRPAAPSGNRPPAPRPLGKQASPYARKLAGLWGVDLNQVTGQGPDGVIQAADVEQARAQLGAGMGSHLIDPAPQEIAEALDIKGNIRAMNAMERAISQSMASSLSMPTFRTMLRAQPGHLIAAAKKRKVSVTVAIAKACALALQKHPMLNNAYVPGYNLAERSNVDIGMAVAAEGGGLVVPVLRDCESRDLEELVTDWKDLVKRARIRRLSPDEYANPTFMVSNMGMMGVEYFDAIPTPGTTAILAISAADEKGMPLTITADHRVVSGAEVASYLNTLKDLIEAPGSWIGHAGPAIPEGDWDYDVVVIGGGPGGEDCARALVEHGVKKVAMINDSPLPGGECLWRGCIPSKTWRAAADRIVQRQHDAHLGITWDSKPNFDWQTLEKSRRHVLEERGKMAYQTDTGMKIKYIQGFASFEDDHHLYIDQSGNTEDPHKRALDGDRSQGERISFGCAVIATGAPPFVPPVDGAKDTLNNGGLLTSDTVWHLAQQPKRLGVVGGGAIGIEMAQIFQDLGSEVVLVEMQDRLLAEAESEVAKQLQALLTEKPRLNVHTSAKVTGVEGAPGEMKLNFTDAENNAHSFDCDYVLMATGKRPVLDPLKLANAGIKSERSVITVDRFCRTNVPHIFAVGDVNGGLMLAHTAGHQGRVAASAILGDNSRRYDVDKDCGVVFTHPQVAFVGLSTEQAKAKGLKPMEIKFPMKLDAKAMINDELEGLIKMVADADSQRVIGVHMLTHHADTLIAGAVMMVSAGLTLAQVGDAIHPHPTQTEIFGEMARRLHSRILRTQKRKKK